MKLENFELSNNYILVALKEHTKVGSVHVITPVTDKFTELVAMGEACQKYKLGDLVLLDDLNYLSMPFSIKGHDKPVKCILAREFNIIGKYTPDEDETKVILQAKENNTTQETSRNLNVIDNPGVENAPYLKEEEENRIKLNSE